MRNLQFVDRSNVGGFFRSEIPFQNGVAIENWPHYVQDEVARLSGKQHIPDEEKLVCAADGSRIWNLSDVSEGKFPLLSAQLTICSQVNSNLLDDQVIGSEQGTEKAEKSIRQKQFASDGDDLLDTEQKIQDYYRATCPWLFTAEDSGPAEEKSEFV